MNPLIYLKISPSTNNDIQNFDLEDGDFLGLYTFNQTHGKGQYNNSWDINPEENVAFSFMLKTKDVKISEILFNFHTATLVRGFIAKLTRKEAEIKWPNDIILNKKKIAGILIEKKKIKNTEVFIVGVGLNVLQTDFTNLPKAGSILTQTNEKFDLKMVAEKLFSHFQKEILNDQGILENFNEHLFFKEKIAVFNLKGKRQNGIIKNADEDGFLLIDLENGGLQKFFHKEIELLY
ncbi:biotin--[acetyl-CoA-carboxylase] ligase [Halpernia frigidisoli]|uniref:BirA family transcriptional regulator, biotin operon repressor / biotin-[acetyl-CoA-carboxylase] ligase n=1 Tax=Halpernia frigidisoli TaxID=1125876 RepID=A0A1I3GPR0_9FLAO|nr:biotin--[acetyl-CoA-carboxylase] ligase [Halpernia frigidisoli]SFI25292.1 BirA family transcriptional regulator, biotin operon repressor / biotin-[acetyl-CoA-carboxylase] ligase [Halpernia frigidisoli]